MEQKKSKTFLLLKMDGISFRNRERIKMHRGTPFE